VERVRGLGEEEAILESEYAVTHRLCQP
jgi:hypothetical protein